MAKRDAILRGVERATELHRDLGLRQKLRAGDRPVDVLAAIRACQITVLFRPLDGLLGAYVPTPRSAGMIVTTSRDHHVQRFTAAHELGHHVLEHRVASFDKSVGFVARGERVGYSEQEVEADAFAAEFLLPKWLVVAHAKRHEWTKQDLKKVDVIYQLSLRLGVSFSATCWALASHGFLTVAEAMSMSPLGPKESKRRAIDGVQPKSWHPDVWVLSEHDRGIQVLGGPDDFLVFDLKEHTAGGYEWNVDAMPAAGLSIHKDERRGVDPAAFGAPITRRVVAQGERIAIGELQLSERRPWEAGRPAINTFEVRLALLGKEPVGLPRRERLLAA